MKLMIRLEMKNYNMILTENAAIFRLEKMINMNFLLVKKYYLLIKAKFTCSPLGQALEKQTKTIDNQGKKQIKALEEHGK